MVKPVLGEVGQPRAIGRLCRRAVFSRIGDVVIQRRRAGRLYGIPNTVCGAAVLVENPLVPGAVRLLEPAGYRQNVRHCVRGLRHERVVVGRIEPVRKVKPRAERGFCRGRDVRRGVRGVPAVTGLVAYARLRVAGIHVPDGDVFRPDLGRVRPFRRLAGAPEHVELRVGPGYLRELHPGERLARSIPCVDVAGKAVEAVAVRCEEHVRAAGEARAVAEARYLGGGYPDQDREPRLHRRAAGVAGDGQFRPVSYGDTVL